MHATVVLTEATGKRIIAKGVVAHPVVQQALVEGTIVVTLGTTNAFVAEELLGEPIAREAFAAGYIDDRFNINARLGELGDLVLRRGERWEGSRDALLDELTAGDVVIKGGNALDAWGTVGVLLGARSGGTVARYHGLALARGVTMVLPISLSKSIHSSIPDLSLRLGADRIERSVGVPCGLYPLTGEVITEIDALQRLYPVEVSHIASGGIGAGAGSVSLLIEGPAEAVNAVFAVVESLAGEEDVMLRGKA
jgi:hypothetical protein